MPILSRGFWRPAAVDALNLGDLIAVSPGIFGFVGIVCAQPDRARDQWAVARLTPGPDDLKDWISNLGNFDTFGVFSEEVIVSPAEGCKPVSSNLGTPPQGALVIDATGAAFVHVPVRLGSGIYVNVGTGVIQRPDGNRMVHADWGAVWMDGDRARPLFSVSQTK